MAVCVNEYVLIYEASVGDFLNRNANKQRLALPYGKESADEAKSKNK